MVDDEVWTEEPSFSGTGGGGLSGLRTENCSASGETRSNSVGLVIWFSRSAMMRGSKGAAICCSRLSGTPFCSPTDCGRSGSELDGMTAGDGVLVVTRFGLGALKS